MHSQDKSISYWVLLKQDSISLFIVRRYDTNVRFIVRLIQSYESLMMLRKQKKTKKNNKRFESLRVPVVLNDKWLCLRILISHQYILWSPFVLLYWIEIPLHNFLFISFLFYLFFSHNPLLLLFNQPKQHRLLLVLTRMTYTSHVQLRPKWIPISIT